LLASAGDCSTETITLWDAASGKKIVTLSGHRPCGFASFAFTADGSTIVSASTPGAVKLWDVATGANRATFVPPEKHLAHRSAFSSDATVLAAQIDHEDTIKVWEIPKDR
jgi:WD40 repeat protein